MTQQVMVITGTRKGIGLYLADHYARQGFLVFGCSRGPGDFQHQNYRHFELSVDDEAAVKKMFRTIRRETGRCDVLINNAGIASMNHVLLTPVDTLRRILDTNVVGSFLFCREAAKLMKKNQSGRMVNFSSLATPLKLEGECAYAASKAAVVSLTEVMAREFAEFGIRVNAVGPPPLKTDLVKNVPQDNLKRLLDRQVVSRFAEMEEVREVVDFLINPANDMITGHTIYLGGV